MEIYITSLITEIGSNRDQGLTSPRLHEGQVYTIHPMDTRSVYLSNLGYDGALLKKVNRDVVII